MTWGITTSLSYTLSSSVAGNYSGPPAEEGPYEESLWPANVQTSGVHSSEASTGISLGTEFTVTEAGRVTAIRFYRTSASANTTFTVGIWNQDTGILAATKVATGLNTVGWQTVVLDTPIEITTGYTYLVSYHQAGSGGNVYYAAHAQYFLDGKYVMSQGERVTSSKCTYNYAATIGRGLTSFQGACYFCDPVVEFDTPATPTVWPTTPADAFPLRAGYPDSTNTGIPSGEKLTVYVGTFRLDRAYTLSNIEVRGQLLVSVDNTTITKCRVIGQTYHALYMEAGVTGTTVTYCNVRNYTLTEGANGIYGEGTIEYNDVEHCDNAIVLQGPSTVRHNYFHGFAIMPEGEGDPHYDGVEIDGGGDHLIEHNTIILNINQTSPIQINNYFSDNYNITVRDNYLCGGGYTIAVRTFNVYSIHGITIEDNYLRSGFYGYYDIQVLPTDTLPVPDGDTLL